MADGNDIWRLSAVDIAAGIAGGKFTSEDAVHSVLGRIDAENGELNAIVYDLSASALDAARAADQAVAGGDATGPLHGVPVTVKENVDQTDTPTTNGLPAFKDAIASEDAPVVANLRKAGAVIVGRTNTPELSMRATTDNPLRGRTKNPWHPDASPGGSSGGAGAAAAAGFGPIHHGNDIGGSLRFPSFACGVCTIKPSLGRVPAYNPSATAERGMLAQLMSVQGPICRHVDDLRLALAAMAAGDPRDPWWVPAPLFDWPEQPRPKIAVTTEAYGYPIHPDIVAGIERAAELLQRAGYTVEQVTTPSIAEPAQGWLDVAVYEIQQTLDPIARQHGSKTVQNIFDWYYAMGDLVDADGYLAGIANRTALTRTWNLFLDEWPLVLSPFLMQPTFDWDYDARGAEQTTDLFRSAIYSIGVNYLSLPAGVYPFGLVDERPAGVQLIGRRYREDLILDAMAVLEAEMGVPAHTLWAREAT